MHVQARRIPGCRVHLGDRPIGITLRRALGALTWYQKLRLAWYLVTSKEPIRLHFMRLESVYTLCLKKTDAQTFCYSFAKIALMSVKIDTHNLHSFSFLLLVPARRSELARKMSLFATNRLYVTNDSCCCCQFNYLQHYCILQTNGCATRPFTVGGRQC